MKVRFILLETMEDTGISIDEVPAFPLIDTIIYNDKLYTVEDVIYSIDQNVCFVIIAQTKHEPAKALIQRA